MIPQEVLSSQTISAPFAFPRNIPRAPLIDYEYGGVAIQDSSRGLRYQVWKGEYVDEQIFLSASQVPSFSLISIPNLDTFGFTFDQNMQPFLCYQLSNGESYFRWFDSLSSGFVTTQLPSGSLTPRCCVDDNRDSQVNAGVSDIILAYVRNGSLYIRAQRDRYEDEYELETGLGSALLLQIGMNRQLRLQFHLSTAVELLESPGTGS